MRAPALAVLVGRLRGAEVRNEPETEAGPEGGAELGWRHGARKRTRCLGRGAAGGLARLLRGRLYPEARNEPTLPTGHDFAQLFVMRSTKERSDWCQHGGAPAARGGTMRPGTATYYESCAMAMDAGDVTARTL